MATEEKVEEKKSDEELEEERKKKEEEELAKQEEEKKNTPVDMRRKRVARDCSFTAMLTNRRKSECFYSVCQSIKNFLPEYPQIKKQQISAVFLSEYLVIDRVL